MASRIRTEPIPQSEWSLHKDAILDFFLREDLTIRDLAERMKSRGLNATISQYEAQFRKWKVRKNLRVSEWKHLFNEVSGLPHDSQGKISIMGHLASEKRIKRARRHCKSKSSCLKRRGLSPKPTSTEIAKVIIATQQHDALQSRQTNATTSTSISYMSQFNSIDSPQFQVLVPSTHYHSNGGLQERVAGHTPDNGIGSASQQPSSGFNWPVTMDWRECSLPMDTSPDEIWGSVSVSTPRWMEELQDPLPPAWSKISVESNPSRWLENLSFKRFEDESGLKNCRSDRRVFHWYTKRAAMLATDTTVGKFLAFLPIPVKSLNIESTLRAFSTLLPDPDFQAINRNAHQTMMLATETLEANFFQLLVFSMCNGFAGLERLPIGRIVVFLAQMWNVGRIFTQFLVTNRSHGAKAFAESLFRAAMAAREDGIIGQALATGLIDVKSEIHSGGRGAELQICHVIRRSNLKIANILPEAGADLPEEDPSDWMRPYERTDWTAEALSLRDSKTPATKHRYLISKLHMITRECEDCQAAEAIGHIVQACEQTDCGECWDQYSEVMDRAFMNAACRGFHRCVDLLLPRCNAIKDMNFQLCVAIRHGRSDWVDSILSCEPDLNAPCYENFRKTWYPELVEFTCPLAEAILAGNIPLVHRLEEAGAWNFLGQQGQFKSVLAATAKTGQIGYTRKVLSRCPSADRKDMRFALLYAIHYHHDEIAFELLDAGANVNYPNDHSDYAGGGDDVLTIAMRRRHRQLVYAILNADISRRIGAESAFREAIQWGDKELLRDLATTFGRYPDDLLAGILKTHDYEMFSFLLEQIPASENDLQNCMEVAINGDDVVMLQYLLERGANASRAIVGEAASHPIILRQLLQYIGQPKRTPTRGFMTKALRKAISGGADNIESVDMLLSSGIIDIEDVGRCQTPLGKAISECGRGNDPKFMIVRSLLDAGCNVSNIVSDNDYIFISQGSALLQAIRTRNKDLVHFLIERGASVDVAPVLGVKRSPLQHAAEVGSLEIVKLLLEFEVDVNAGPSIRSGGTALQFAAISGNCNIAAELLSRGALLHTPPSKVNGRWPIEGAAEHGRLHMIEYLWKAKENSSIYLENCETGFEPRHCYLAMKLAEKNRHFACRDLISQLSGLFDPASDMDLDYVLRFSQDPYR
ncbi:hypothetical protein F5B20DRAFT_148854 [Whalleya microplaca]|nr:hypothetical protein F5B20DRAFT_148854 [Whalleya microplaca]